METWMWVAIVALVLWLHGYSSGRKRSTRDIGDAVGMLRSMLTGK